MVILLGQDTASLDWVAISVGMACGLALFLFGLELLADGLKIIAGGGLRTILAKLTKNRFAGVVTGMLVTAAVQSSSVTTVLLVGLISAGLMSMSQAVGVIMGANIGSTFTAQIIAFKLTNLAMALIALGFALSFMPRYRGIRPYGRALMALGLVFFGMNMMGDAVRPLRAYEPFIEVMSRMDQVGWAVLIGALFTSVVQSSAATLGIVIMLAGQGFISLPAGIALALGANIGTCITAMLAAIGKPRDAVRAALVHVLFNVVGVLLWVGLVNRLATVVEQMTPGDADVPRQIANAHTIFNVANTVVLIWFAGAFAWIVRKVIPDRPERADDYLRPKYLDDALLDTPPMALPVVRQELRRMGKRVDAMIDEIPGTILNGSRRDLDQLEAMDEDVDTLHGYIIAYLGDISRRELSSSLSRQVGDLMAAANHLEQIGDTIETNIVALGRRRLAANVTASEATLNEIRPLAAQVSDAVSRSVQAVADDDEQAALEVIGMKRPISRLADAAYAHQARRLIAPEPNRVDLYSIEADLIENIKRIYYFSKRMAKTVQRHDDDDVIEGNAPS